MNLTKWKTTLERAGVAFAPGLSSAELSAAEAAYGMRFPPDLGELLCFAVPMGDRFPDWRELSSSHVEAQLRWPLEGICFDVEHDGFWLGDWGPRPTGLRAAFEVVRRHVEAAPGLIPICGHRYLPDRPTVPGNPVFSIYQTDIIHYGSDLENHYHNEFNAWFGTPHHQISGEVREIEFWSRLVG